MNYTEKQVEEILNRVWEDRIKGGGWSDKNTFINTMKKVNNLDIPVVSISSLAEKAKEEERLNREKMITNYNAPLDKIHPYENKHLLALIDEILKELN